MSNREMQGDTVGQHNTRKSIGSRYLGQTAAKFAIVNRAFEFLLVANWWSSSRGQPIEAKALPPDPIVFLSATS
jgi:hypothetical protein